MREREASTIPSWAEAERQGDLDWIGDNLATFWSAASLGFSRLGRGALVTDITVLVKQAGQEGQHPYIYLSAADVQRYFQPQIGQLVEIYNPTQEFVAVLLKEQRHSTYRIQVPSA